MSVCPDNDALEANAAEEAKSALFNKEAEEASRKVKEAEDASQQANEDAARAARDADEAVKKSKRAKVELEKTARRLSGNPKSQWQQQQKRMAAAAKCLKRREEDPSYSPEKVAEQSTEKGSAYG